MLLAGLLLQSRHSMPVKSILKRLIAPKGSQPERLESREHEQQPAALHRASEGENRFRQVVENIDGVFWMTNVDKSQMLYISPGYERIWGRSCDELYESPSRWAEAIHPEDRERVLNQAQTQKQIAGEYNEDYRIVRPDGSMRWIRDRAFLVRDECGKVDRIVGIATDITEQRNTEELLLKSETESRVIFENAPLGMALVDPDGHPIKTNPALQRLLGYTEEELREMSFKEFTHPEDVEKDWSLYQELVEGKREDYQIEKRYIRKDKELVSARLTVSLVHGTSKDRICAVGMVEDITEKRKLENQFMRGQRLESIGMLAGGIAHDLNNLLAPIIMSSGLLMQEANDEKRLKLLKAIDASAKRGTELVKQIITFARGKEGCRTLLHPEQLIEEVINIARHAFPKQIRIEKQVPGKLWELWGDSTQLHQVLLNLCVNARDAMPTGGDLTISAHNILVDDNRAAKNPELKPGPHLVISIKDTGFGIAPHVLTKVFEPFFTTKESGKGTGLGLSTAVGIVKSHGGSICLTSEAGKGTEFAIWLPASPSGQPSARQLQYGQVLRGHGDLVLVVDDEAAVRALTRETLEAEGYKVLTAENGPDALAICSKYQDSLKVVITDLMMPGMDGMDLIRNLLPINPALRIIALSGSPREEVQSTALNAGAQVFLSKPFTVETLLNGVQELISRR